MNSAMLALDPGRSCGVAFRRADGTVHHRTWRLEGIGGGRLVAFDRLLNALHSVERFARIGYERPFFSPRHPSAAEPLIEMTGHLKYWAAARGLPYAGYQPAAVTSVSTAAQRLRAAGGSTSARRRSGLGCVPSRW